MLVVTAVTEVALAFVIVGAPFYRTVKQAVKRLGLRLPTLRDIGFGLGLVIVAYMIAVLSSAIARLRRSPAAEARP